jgi:hypothetical protein
MPPPLVVDNRATVAGPGLHAFIVGVSEYLHMPDPGPNIDLDRAFGMAKLASPALSAFRIYQWLTGLGKGSLAVPLKTCRLLLAPSALEKQREPALTQIPDAGPATRDDFVDAAHGWRSDASDAEQSITLFYFAGHGVRKESEESIITLEDFGQPNRPRLQNAVSVDNLRKGMAPTPSRPVVAATQFYFVDACRNTPQQMSSFAAMPTPITWDPEANLLDKRATPTYFAVVDGGLAIARKGTTTVFCEALLHALGRGAEVAVDDGSWPVTSLTLKRAIDRYLQRTHGNAAPAVDLRGAVAEPTLVHLPQAPPVEIDIEVEPMDLAGQARIALLNAEIGDGNAGAAFEDLQQPRVTRSVTAGIYCVGISSPRLSQDYRSVPRMVTQAMPPMPWRHKAPV